MAKNNHNIQNNEEESEIYEIGKIQESIYASLDKAKKHIDNNQDPISCIIFLDFIKQIYDANVIPLLKEEYSSNPLRRELSLARANKAHEMFDGLYQHVLKKVESFGIGPSEFSELKISKSLENLTFPENN